MENTRVIAYRESVREKGVASFNLTIACRQPPYRGFGCEMREIWPVR
jgi:hypothetical protein